MENCSVRGCQCSREVVSCVLCVVIVILSWCLVTNFCKIYLITQDNTMSMSGEFGNPLRKFKLVFLGEQSGELRLT